MLHLGLGSCGKGVRGLEFEFDVYFYELERTRMKEKKKEKEINCLSTNILDSDKICSIFGYLT